MASLDPFPPRNNYRVRFTVSVGRLKRRRSRYKKTQAAARALFTRVCRLEEASRDGLAEDREIRQWLEDGLLKPDEAAVAFRGWAETEDRTPAPLHATDFDALLDAYETYALRTSKARDPFRKTHTNHMSVARQAKAWLEDTSPHLPDLTEEMCREYQDELAAKLAPWTVFHRLTKLRLLLDRAVEAQMIEVNPARALKLRQPRRETQRRILTTDEACTLLKTSLNYTDWINGGVPLAVRLGLYAGLRDEEMCWAKWEWLQGYILAVQRSKSGPGQVWTPKDHEARRLDVKDALVDYLSEIRHEGWFILRGRYEDRPMASGSLSRAFKWFIGAIGMDPAITLYSLRHTYATELLRTSDLRTVQRRLGHASIQTTEQYLHEIEPESRPTDRLPY
jgi:integrase